MGKIAISFEKKKKLESTKIVSEINENPFYENKRKKRLNPWPSSLGPSPY